MKSMTARWNGGNGKVRLILFRKFSVCTYLLSCQQVVGIRSSPRPRHPRSIVEEFNIVDLILFLCLHISYKFKDKPVC